MEQGQESKSLLAHRPFPGQSSPRQWGWRGAGKEQMQGIHPAQLLACLQPSLDSPLRREESANEALPQLGKARTWQQQQSLLSLGKGISKQFVSEGGWLCPDTAPESCTGEESPLPWAAQPGEIPEQALLSGELEHEESASGALLTTQIAQTYNSGVFLQK